MLKGLILAGGLNSGLLPLTRNTPKALLPVGTYPLLLFQIQQFKKAGITEVILSLAFQPRKIRDVFGDGSNFGITLRYTVESTPVGTAGALKGVEHLIDDTTVVINGDVLTEASLEQILKNHRENRAEITIGTCRVSDPRSYGIVESESDDRIQRFIERPRGEKVRTDVINAGIYVVEPNVLDWILPEEPVQFEQDLFPVALENGSRLFSSQIDRYWREITRPDNYLLSNLEFLNKEITKPSFAAFPKKHHLPRGPDVTVSGSSMIDAQCTLKPGVRIESSVIGSNCRIEEGSVIRNSVLWPGCRVQSNSFVSGSILGKCCVIGEGARVRKGNILGDRSTLTPYSQI